jgi:hypothetical protein
MAERATKDGLKVKPGRRRSFHGGRQVCLHWTRLHSMLCRCNKFFCLRCILRTWQTEESI